MSKLKTFMFLSLFFLVTIIFSSCGNLEIDINKDYSGEMIFNFEVSEYVSEEEIVDRLETSCDEANEMFGKEVYKIESTEKKDDELEIVLSFIAFDEYKNVTVSEKSQDFLTKYSSEYNNNFSDFYCGSYEEFFDYTNAISENSVEKLVAKGSNEFISLTSINTRRKMGIINISDEVFSDIESIKINTPGKILYHSTNVDLEDSNTGEFSGEEGIIIFDNPRILSTKTYITLLILLILLAVFIFIKSKPKTCECGNTYEKGSVFCSNCGKKAKRLDFFKINKILLIAPALVVILLIVLPVVKIIMDSNIFAGNIDKEKIIDSLDNKIVYSEYGDGEYTIKKDKINSLEMKNYESSDGIYDSKGTLSFKSNNFNINSDVKIKFIYIPGKGWKLVNLQYENLTLTPYSGPDKSSIKEAFENQTIKLDGKTKEGNSSVGSINLYNIEYSIKIIEEDDTIEDNKADVKITLSAENQTNITNVNLNCVFSFDQESEGWIFESSTVEDSSIEYVYSGDFKDTPLNEKELLDYIDKKHISVGDERYKVFSKDKFKTFELQNIEYNSSGNYITYKINIDYKDDELSYSGIWNEVLEYKNNDSNDNWTIESDFEKDINLKMATYADIVNALQDKGTLDGEEFVFEDDTPENFKIIKRSDADSDEEIEVSFVYDSKTVKFKLVFGNVWGYYECKSIEQTK